MSLRELKAAGITDPNLQKSFELCRQLNAAHGKTYYLATLLLPPEKRPYVHALYGFARYADEIVDDLESTLTGEEKSQWLTNWSDQFFKDLEIGFSTDPICAATIYTAKKFNIPREHFEAFIHSMKMDLTTTSYETYEDLYEYVYGSAAVIGLQMVPILEPSSEDAYKFATDLGVAFQLANFIRDIGEDLERGRIYLPLSELRQFSVTPETLNNRVVDDNLRNALRFQIARVHELEQRSRAGITLLEPSSQPCIEAARILYCGIANQVEKIDFDVFNKRAKVPNWKRLTVAGLALIESWRLR
jgi:phytoene synthase